MISILNFAKKYRENPGDILKNIIRIMALVVFVNSLVVFIGGVFIFALPVVTAASHDLVKFLQG